MCEDSDNLNEYEFESWLFSEEVANAWNISAATFRTIMSQIPGLAMYSQIWSELDNYKACVDQRKTNEFLKRFTKLSLKFQAEIKQRIENLECSLEEKGNRIAVLERIIDCLAKEIEFPKVQLLAQVTVNCIIEDSMVWDKKMRAIDSFRQVTLSDLAILKQFSEKHIVQVKNIVSDSLEELIPSLCKLSSIGLIFEMPNAFFGDWTPSVESEWKNAWPNKYYEILPAGQELLIMIAE